jgi:glycosyltransferase involved in cell wall biosynthesis
MSETPTQAQAPHEWPFVSVVMPVRNEADFIARSLGCVTAQDYPRERFEVIVADGMSTDATREIVRSLANGAPPVRLVDNPRQIAPTGLNAAIAQARGEIIVRVDGHCEIAPDYLRNCVRHLQNGAVDGVGGPLETVGATPPARAIAAAMSSPFGVGGSAFRTVKGKTMLTDTIAFPAYTRAIVERAGTFDEELVRNQDDEYNYRLRKLGAKLLLAADVRARYYSRSTLGSLFRQYFQYGFWKVRVLQKHPRQMRWRQFVPPLFVVSLLGAALFTLVTQTGWLALLFLLVSYLAAVGVATAWTARECGWRCAWWLPPAFAALHVGYGLGFLLGLIKFWRDWQKR